MTELRFTVSLPTDEGFFGRACKNPECGRYFKVHLESIKQEMFCPYCGTEFSNNELFTEDQAEHLREVTTEKAKEFVSQEFGKIFGDLARSARKGPVRIEYRPSNYKARQIVPSYQERKVDSQLTCPDCSFVFQVDGIFGFCPGCRSENILVYDANLAIIKREITSSSNPQRALRHAYADLVSTFETFCRSKAKSVNEETTRFQRLFDVRRFFKK
ncbi:hypothetical protein MYX82_10325 [Acidobacteria bacterium AH-259-D05]|nr:hypothetical protein [Acidobacteria bacterium AH-259-D05]